MLSSPYSDNHGVSDVFLIHNQKAKKATFHVEGVTSESGTKFFVFKNFLSRVLKKK